MESKHTKEWPCGCQCSHGNGRDELNYCSLHNAAPAMLEALVLAKTVVSKVLADNLMPNILAKNFPQMVLDHIDAAIAQAKKL